MTADHPDRNPFPRIPGSYGGLSRKSVTYPEMMEVSPQEFDTIIAALRFWQRQGLMARHDNPEWLLATERGAPLSSFDIESLCRRLRKNSPNLHVPLPPRQD